MSAPVPNAVAVDLRDDWQTMRRRIRELFEERLAHGIWPVDKKGKLTKAGGAQAFDWLLGIHVGLTLSGDETGLGPMVFIASVRGVEDATRIPLPR